jgi:hypothetical protein
MGHLVFLAAIEGLRDAAPLHAIDPSMPWRAFRHEACDLMLVEWLKVPNRNNVQAEIKFPNGPEFGRRPAGVSFDDRFGDDAPGLDALYARLGQERRAETLSKVAVHSALMLSRLTGCRVLSIASDDDAWDIGCTARDGKLELLAFASDEGEETTLDALGTVETLTVDESLIHRIAMREASSLCDGLAALFGFDGDAGALGLVEAGRVKLESPSPESPPEVSPQPSPEAPPPARRPFWKIW